jgi:hypothetical protein
VLLSAVLLAACGSSSPAPSLPAPVNRIGPESIFSPGRIEGNPEPFLATLRQLGVDRVRLFVWWNQVAPDPTSPRRPAGFDGSDPAAYPAANWAYFDGVVHAAQALGLGIDMVFGGPPPRWAEGPRAPQPSVHTWWKPNAGEYGQFVRAVATRYDGHYTPADASTPLPRVNFWSIWNEPNLGFQLAPQAIDHSTIEVAPRLYRALVNAAWTALEAVGDGHDTILIGELGPAGEVTGAGPGNFNAMAPLRFVRALYCVDSAYQPLTGAAAAARGCPATAAASTRFAAQNPALFHASGFAIHPYSQGLPPDVPTPDEPDFAELAALPRLESTLDAIQRTYGSGTRFRLYSTEFGYQTTPPDEEDGVVSPALAAYYLNWAEYLTWRDPRLVSFDQYQLSDDSLGNFATGLEFNNGVPKPGYYAYRLPLYLPVTTTASGRPLEVWGCVRPARYAKRVTGRPQAVSIQLAAGSGPFHTVRTVTITDPYGYFDVRQTFSTSGQVRLAWSYPGGPEIFSRTVSITIR